MTTSQIQDRSPTPGSAIDRPLEQVAIRRWDAPRCGYYANAFMLSVGKRFLRVSYALIWLIAISFMVFVPRVRRASMAYLDRLHAPRRRGVLERWGATYRHMVEFGFLLVDRALMLAGQNHGFAVKCEGLPHFIQATARRPGETPQGLLLLTAHLGISEIAAPMMRLVGVNRRIHIVMYQDSSDGTEDFHTRHRHLLANISIISTTDPLTAGVKIMGALKSGDIVCMRADRTLNSKGISVALLGQPLQLPTGPFLAAALSGAPVLHVYTCRTGFRQYTCTLTPPRSYGDAEEEGAEPRDARLQRAAQDFANELERVVRQFPYQWANFFDIWSAQRPMEMPLAPGFTPGFTHRLE